MSNFGMYFGQVVRKYREIEGLTAEQLALKALGDGAKRSRISELENGKVKKPHATTVAKLADALGISPEEIEACRNPPVEETGEAPSFAAQKAGIDLPGELLENLCQRFGIDNPDAPQATLIDFLKEKAREWKALKERLAELEALDNRLSNQMAAAEDAISRGKFREADDILAGAEEIQAQEKALAEAQKTANIRVTRAEAALFDNRPDDAAAHYQKAFAYIAPFDEEKAANLSNDHAIKMRDHGLRFGGSALSHAATFWQSNLEVFPRDTAPQDWATTQNNLGNALGDLANRSKGKEARELLQQAITAFNKALEIRTKEDMPQQWAMTQNNLANLYFDMAEKNMDRQENLKIALAHVDNALTVYDAQYSPYFYNQASRLREMILAAQEG